MKKQTIFILLLFAATIFFQSCDSDDNSSTDSRDVKYEMTGNFSGKFTAAATTNNGTAEAIEINKLPWKLEFKAKETVKSLVVTATGTGGTAGQTATLKVFVGDKEVSTSTATALSSGIITINSTLYTFK
jgi:hypothetical protein